MLRKKWERCATTVQLRWTPSQVIEKNGAGGESNYDRSLKTWKLPILKDAKSDKTCKNADNWNGSGTQVFSGSAVAKLKFGYKLCRRTPPSRPLAPWNIPRLTWVWESHRIENRATPTICALPRAQGNTGWLENRRPKYGLSPRNNRIGRLVLVYRNTASGRIYD
jgi:hypothetical protein